VARATLRLLHHRFRAQGFGYCANFFCLMAHDREQLRCFQWLARTNHMFDERSPARVMQNFGQLGTHARSFAGRKN
jgi:hypothetical protein